MNYIFDGWRRLCHLCMPCAVGSLGIWGYLSSDDDMCPGLGTGYPTFLETCARSMLPGTALWVLLFFGEPTIIVSHGSMEPEAVG